MWDNVFIVLVLFLYIENCPKAHILFIHTMLCVR